MEQNISTVRQLPENQYLTPLTYSLILKSVKHGNTFRMHPYEWNEPIQRVERNCDTKHLAVWYLTVLFTVVYFVFVTVRAVQVFQNENASIRETILAGFGVAFFAFPTAFQLTYFFYGDEFPGLFNQCLQLLSDLNRDIPPANLRPNQRYPIEVRAAEFLGCNFYYGFPLLGILILIFAFALPETKFLISSLHDDPRNLWMPYRLLFMTYSVYLYFNYVIGSWVIGMGSALTFPLCAALQSLGNRQLTSKTLKYYRCIQLWISKFNRIANPLILPIAEILLISLTILGIVGVIRYPGFTGLAVGSVGLTAYPILYLLLSFYGTIDERSRKILDRWRFEARGSNARQLRALRPISITIGSYCFIDRCLILTATKLIIDNSITLLLVE